MTSLSFFDGPENEFAGNKEPSVNDLTIFISHMECPFQIHWFPRSE